MNRQNPQPPAAPNFAARGFPSLQPTAMDEQMRPPPGSILDKIVRSEAQKQASKTTDSGDRGAGARDPRKQTLVLQSNQLHFAKQMQFDNDASLLKQELDKIEKDKALKYQEEKEARERLERKRLEDKRREEHRIAMARLIQDQIQKEKDEKEKELEMDKAVILA